ncbi:MAG: FkbM family methyltransferase [Litoreibacter sp.]|nr:FkbM family methyltransferase [Litoreibacter sp.]
MLEFELDGFSFTIPRILLSDRLAGKLRSGNYEMNDARAVRSRLQPGDRVLELGTGLGYVGALCAEVVGPDRVTCVEAHPDMVEVARNNLARNGFSATQVIHGALTPESDSDPQVAFRMGPAFWSSALARPQDDPADIVEVPALKLGALLEVHKPNMLIVDIEGGEAFLFEDPLPARLHTVVVELHPGRYPPTVIKQVFDFMSANGLTYDPDGSRGGVVTFQRVAAA